MILERKRESGRESVGERVSVGESECGESECGRENE